MAEATSGASGVRVEGAVAEGILVAFDDGRRACLVRCGGAGRTGPYTIDGRPFFLAPWTPPPSDPAAGPDEPDEPAVDATHPWTGRRLPLGPSVEAPTGTPPKVLVARVGALLLVLGLASGRVLGVDGHAVVEVDASEATLACDGVVLRAARGPRAAPGPLRIVVPEGAGRCRLAVGPEPGTAVDVDLAPGRHLACVPDSVGSLTCSTR